MTSKDDGRCGRHHRHRRRPHGQPDGLRRDADHRPRDLGRSAGPGAGQGGAPPGARARGQLHRHRRLLRPGGQRDPDRRDPLPLPGRPGHRDQGRPGPARPEPLGPGRPPRAPARGLRGQPAAAEARADPALPVPRPRPQGAAGRLHRRPGRAEGARARSGTSGCRTSPPSRSRRRSGSSPWCRCRTATT